MPWGAITILLQRPWSTTVEDLIGMVQYEFNHHLLDPDCQKGCISIVYSGFDLFTPARKKCTQSDSALQQEASSMTDGPFVWATYFNFSWPIRVSLPMVVKPNPLTRLEITVTWSTSVTWLQVYKWTGLTSFYFLGLPSTFIQLSHGSCMNQLIEVTGIGYLSKAKKTNEPQRQK